MPHLDLAYLVKTFGYFGLFFMVFAESGLFFGFFFPGDSLLFTAGFLASQNFFHIGFLVPLLILAAIGGDSAGFWTGKKLGTWLLKQKENLIFKKSRIEKARVFYEKYGGKALILARFIPAVRTFVPIAAGIADMHYPDFIKYNIIGGFLWATGMTLAGYFLGSLIPDVDKYLLPIIFLIIGISVVPIMVEFLKAKKGKTTKH